MKKVFTRDLGTRVLKTFIQAFLGSFSAALVLVQFNGDLMLLQNTILGLSVASIAAGVAAVMNMIQNLLNTKGVK